MYHEEFSKPERERKLGVRLWPSWHFGVLSMYAAHISLNHLSASKQFNVIKLRKEIDASSSNKRPVASKIHIHVFHGSKRFSKSAFKAGLYDGIKSVENLTEVDSYCLKMALDGRRLTYLELKHLLDAQIVRKK